MLSLSPHERQANASQFSSPTTTKAHRKPRIAFNDNRHVRDREEESGTELTADDEEQNFDEEDENEASLDDELAPLLPIFESSHLDALPVYNLTHAIHLLVVPRCETTLTWDQLRSPQVSQFMIKPIQKNILISHFSRATLYALLSNCLQFSKEAAENPGNAGTSRTRAMVCELLAIRLLKEYSIRELIDALSYDFYPLQGLNIENSDVLLTPRAWELSNLTRQQARTARVSTLEIAIRTGAKRFLAHPVVVQQLEAIWAGTIVFHSAADSAHRSKHSSIPKQGSTYGSIQNKPSETTSYQTSFPLARKTVTIYDPQEASLFKLSRLRVPRYRSFFSTLSLAILLCLFVAVLAQKSVHITGLEIIFWFWSAGFMLDEVVGLTDTGFSLYLLSFWNAFDLGILFVLVVFYCLRLYGLVIADEHRKSIAYLAYDVLGLNAILLFPRLFSVLDHYRYFSQLLIAFRIMARDLVAVLVLIGISCSGFFVAFTLAFGNEEDSPSDVAYTLFQLIMGFTPAAWDKWAGYNRLGQAALILFLFITHFLVVTILITVLTNSFMAIVQNANDEHQFVFAINTISMVKSDALFSYVAPTNVLAWGLTPLRSCLPFREYVKLNRTIIKITHFPILFGICAYERLVLRRSAYEPTDLIERRGRLAQEEQKGLFASRTVRTRGRSSAAMYQDKALDAVFQRPVLRSGSRLTRNISGGSARPDRVDTWISQMDEAGSTGPLAEQDHGILDRLEGRRLGRPNITPRRSSGRKFTNAISIASDPENFRLASSLRRISLPPFGDRELRYSKRGGPIGPPGSDGDDELVLSDEVQPDLPTPDPLHETTKSANAEDYLDSKTAANPRLRQTSTAHSPDSMDFDLAFEDPDPNLENKPLPPSKPSTRVSTRPSTRPSSRGATIRAKQREVHNRTFSTNTILYNPIDKSSASSTTVSKVPITITPKERKLGLFVATTPQDIPASSSPSNRKLAKQRRLPLNERNNSISFDDPSPQENIRSTRRSYSFDIVSDLGDNKAPAGGYMATMPASFGTHMEFMSRSRLPNNKNKSNPSNNNNNNINTSSNNDNEEQRRMTKLMLSRMNTLEQSFREVLHEVKDWRRNDTVSSDSQRTTLLAVPISARRGGGGSSQDVKGFKTLGEGKKDGKSAGQPVTALSSPRKMGFDREEGNDEDGDDGGAGAGAGVKGKPSSL